MAIVDAIVLNVIILTVGRLATGAFPVVELGDDEQTVGYTAVVIVTSLVGLIAWGLLTVLERVAA